MTAMRGVATLAWGLAGACVVVTLPACVLADPAPTLPLVYESVPDVVSQLPQGPILATWPTDFVISVSVDDPTVTLIAQAFIDYSPARLSQPDDVVTQLPISGSNAMMRTLTIPDLAAPLGPGCHTVLIIIASSFLGIADPAPPGGAYVQWVYTGTGSIEGCVSYDAGALADGSFPPDAAADAADAVAP